MQDAEQQQADDTGQGHIQRAGAPTDAEAVGQRVHVRLPPGLAVADPQDLLEAGAEHALRRADALEGPESRRPAGETVNSVVSRRYETEGD